MSEKLKISKNLRPKDTELEKKELVEYSEEWLKSKVFINRDNNKRYTVKNFTDGAKWRMVQLVEKGQEIGTTNLVLADFVSKLKLAGSPWRVE
jgi:hypothetical protein